MHCFVTSNPSAISIQMQLQMIIDYLFREREKFSSSYRKILYLKYDSGGTVVEHMILYVRVLGLKMKC
jgi:hypothetical protein